MHEGKAQLVSKTNCMHGLHSWSQDPLAAPGSLSQLPHCLVPCVHLVIGMSKTLTAAATVATPVRAVGSQLCMWEKELGRGVNSEGWGNRISSLAWSVLNSKDMFSGGRP